MPAVPDQCNSNEPLRSGLSRLLSLSILADMICIVRLAYVPAVHQFTP